MLSFLKSFITANNLHFRGNTLRILNFIVLFMKILLITLCCFFPFSCQSDKKPSPLTSISTDEIEVAKSLIQGSFDDLWAGLDSTKISIYHTNDFIILEQGQVWDNSMIKNYMRNQLKQTNRPIRTNKMEFIQIEKYGNSIQLAYYNYATFTKNDSIVGNARWLESALAVKSNDGWRLKMMHSTRLNTN
jgi:hypothetical protein